MWKRNAILLIAAVIAFSLLGCDFTNFIRRQTDELENTNTVTACEQPKCTPLTANDSGMEGENADSAAEQPAKQNVLAATPAPAKQFSIVWLSDPQFNSEEYPQIWDCMTDWIVENVIPLNIRYVIITGDFVNHMDADAEWQNATIALSKLDGVVPLLTVAGNHDVDQHHADYTRYLHYFGDTRSPQLTTVADTYENGRGRCDLLDAGGQAYMLLSLGYSVDEAGIQWLNNMLSLYPERQAILCFHGYLAPDGSYTSDGGKLAKEVVQKNANVRLVLCGHRHGVYHRTFDSANSAPEQRKHPQYELLADYQEEQHGGNGYLCILTFGETSDAVHVTTYSPWLKDYNCFNNAPETEDFVLDLQ